MIRFSLLLAFVLILFTSCAPKLNGTMVDGLNEKGVITEKGKNIAIPGYSKGEAAVFYLVRHAEKQKGKDPDLTEEGLQRAKKLSKILESVKLSTIYSTNTKRTIYTASPSAEVQKMEIDSYDHKKQGELFKPLMSKKGEHFLIVGHSNTIPDMLNLFQDKTVYEHIDESVYDNLYVVMVYAEDKVKIIELKY